MAEELKHLLVLSTCPGSITAKQIAQDLVANDIAACVNIVPGLTSYFKWSHKVESDVEFLLLIKTTSVQLPTIKKRIKSLHPYELPEIIAVSIEDGLEEYLSWVADSTR